MAVLSTQEWPTLAQAEANREAILEESAIEMERLEAKFGIPSSEIAARISSGEVEQTAEVCHWLLVLEVFKSVRRDQSS